jgi:molybdenum cofactor guanylyltransferase
MNLTGAVLAGGRSRRFGQPKAIYEWKGKPMLLYPLEALAEVCHERLVVARPDTPLPALPNAVHLYYDEFPFQHPLSGLLTALRRASYPLVFVCAVDMPTLQPVLIRWMVEQLGEADAVVPEVEGRLQPLHALYRREVAPRLAEFFSPSLDHLTDSANPEKKILEEALHTSPSLPALQVVIRTLRLRLLTPPEWQTLDPEGISFRNWNTPD